MRTMTIEELLMKEDDATLINIHDELESGLVPATSYAHEYVRKVNHMIDEGKLCIIPGKYRNVYLPTISKLIYKEMARRYAMHCYCMKAPASATITAAPIMPSDTPRTCARCNGEFKRLDLHHTDIGMLCDACIDACRRDDECITVYD